jgi:hypothetical protein
MPVLPRNRPHLYLRNNGESEPYTSKTPPPRQGLPQRDGRRTRIREAITVALAAVYLDRQERDTRLVSGTPGFYLDFGLPPGSENAAELLEDRLKHIELVAFRQPDRTQPALATVFVSDSARDYYLSKIDRYKVEDTKKGHPKGEALVARIVVKATLRSVFTDDSNLFPEDDRAIWWEAWLRAGHTEPFHTLTRRPNLQVQQTRFVFPDREVCLVYADIAAMGKLFFNCDSIAELRRAKDTPGQFVSWSNAEQAEWTSNLAQRLIAPALSLGDIHRYEPTWEAGDARGHGTNMAGLVLYEDLASSLGSTQPVVLTHRRESVKILPDQGQNDPKLYGAITRDAIAQAEVSAPERKRAVCLAITSGIDTNRGRPSSWSAAIDQVCFGEEDSKRLILVSAGNIRDDISKENYPAQNEVEPIENPAQAWNAITVGAFTEKMVINDPSFAGWVPLASEGELCPTSRTSVSWERQWPVKPDILMDGGNWATLPPRHHGTRVHLDSI